MVINNTNKMTNEDIKEQVEYLKKELNAVVLVHTYQKQEVQELGDFVGDSLGLCIEASKTNADTIIFCGVRFMAESAKLLNPEKQVILAERHSGCPMADMINADILKTKRKEYPNSIVVCYVNSSAAVKAESDICCTSSNAETIINSIEETKDIFFIPDTHLASYTAERTGREIIRWPGYCPTHAKILPEFIEIQKREHPQAAVCVHPECSHATRSKADFIGSTEAIFRFCSDSTEYTEFIIGTEQGILSRLKKANPEKSFFSPATTAVCPNMKRTNAALVLRILRYLREKGEDVQFHEMDSQKDKLPFEIIELNEETANKAKKPIQKMMEISNIQTRS